MKKLCLIFAILLLIGSVSAASVDYQIINNRVLVEANFGEVEDFELLLPYDIDNFESNAFYNITEENNQKILKVETSNNLSISYVANGMLEESRTKNFFIMNNHYNDKIDVKLFLPEGGILMKDYSLIYPVYAHIGTDGRRVFLEWKNFEDDEIVVAYELVSERSMWLYVLIALIIGFGIFYLIQATRLRRQIKLWKGKHKETKKKHKERAKKSISKNLYGDEKKIIDYLAEKKECWNKEMVKDLEIPKVRLSRKLRSLQEKGLIEKEPHGNENRVKLVKRV